MTRIAIVAALPGELKPLVGDWPHERRNGVDLWRRQAGKDEWIAVCAGAGQAAATRAFAEIEKDGAITHQAISIGWAGALRDDLEPGKAYRVAGVIDTRTGERFPCAESPSGLWLATSPTVADAAEKRRLAAAYSAALVDMEGAAIARLAAMRRIPFYAIKGVSDGFRDRLPDLNRFIAADGRFQTARFALFAAVRPVYWPGLIRMGENSRRASRSIADLLRSFLASTGPGT